MVRIDERLIPMEGDDDAGVEGAGHLRHTIRTARVITSRPDDLAAETLDGGHDARIVGGDDDLAGAPRTACLLVDVLDEILAGLAQERFAGQARGSVARGDDD